MPSWWGRSSSKEKKKENKESFIDAIHRKFKIGYEEKCSRSVGPRRRGIDTISERGSRSRAQSRSPSPSTLVSRCQSFAERPLAQPLPLPRLHLKDIQPSDSENNVAAKHVLAGSSQPSPVLPLPRPDSVQNRLDSRDIEGDAATGSISSDTSSDCCDPSDSRLLSPQVSDHENHNRTAFSRHTSMMQKDISPNMKKRNLKETAKPIDKLFHNQILPTSPKKASLRARVPNIQIPHHGAFCSAPDSSMSSPSRSPMRIYGHDQVISPVSWAGKTYQDVVAIGSGHCSSPGSGYNSGHNSVGGDMSGPLFWPQSRCSPECSPIPSPRMASPGPNSRIQSGAVTPLHPRAGATESPSSRPEDGKQQSHRLPLPPIKVPNNCPFLPAYSTSTTPSVPRSPGRSENSLSPGSHWKKGRLLGRGTFGHVYLGFNSESGEMCAMKEVTLFSDDPKSKESVQQLGQEIALLSRLRHPNIVQYYGSETVDDKLYIYLEYVSGGSIYKLLQEYGQFGEIAMRNYTQQILSGLAYLHAKNTVHRDIKGANILVDPNGRVKLADFGMAKHITGQSCPLSFKGSPYWMAPEVIKNSNGRNLAVDIWSLGCTVLEMATTKPPWSQYEGVAAMFKIGNSKELPVIPDTLSDEGKDFVRKCLQRNPLNRPTAAQLLEHPFVNNVAQLERCILNLEHLEPTPPVMNSATSLGVGYAKNVRYLDSGGVVNQFRGERTGSGSSASHMPKNMSCPVSPIGSPLLHSRSPRHTTRAMSPSPISSPRAISGSSTPLTGGSGAISFQQSRTACLYKATGASSVSPNRRYPHANNTYYQDTNADRFGSMPQVPKIFRENSSSENGNNKFEPSPRGHPRDLDHGQLFFADRVSQKLLRDHVKMNLSQNLNHGSQMLGHANGV